MERKQTLEVELERKHTLEGKPIDRSIEQYFIEQLIEQYLIEQVRVRVYLSKFT